MLAAVVIWGHGPHWAEGMVVRLGIAAPPSVEPALAERPAGSGLGRGQTPKPPTQPNGQSVTTAPFPTPSQWAMSS